MSSSKHVTVFFVTATCCFLTEALHYLYGKFQHQTKSQCTTCIFLAHIYAPKLLTILDVLD